MSDERWATKPMRENRPVRSWLARRSLASQVLLLPVAVVALAIAAGAPPGRRPPPPGSAPNGPPPGPGGGAAVSPPRPGRPPRRDSAESARQRTLGAAETFAHSPDVLAALHTKDPAADLQPMAESIRRATGVDFVVVMSRDRVRYSHPNQSLIGGRF